MDDLGALGTATGRSVSIFMPTARGGAETREGPIRLKSLVKDAETELKAHGASEEETSDILAPMMALLEDPEPWQRMADGLALYASSGLARAYRVAHDFPEAVHVSDRFAVRPIVPAAVGDGGFLILALSQNKVRLFEATSATVRELDIGPIPSSLKDADGKTQREPQLQHQSTPGGQGGYHGHGAGEEIDDVIVDKFLHQVAGGLDELLGPTERRPLVLASVSEYHSPFRGYLSYENLVDEAAAGNPDASSGGELQERAWSIVDPVLRAATQQDAERFGDATGADRALTGGSEILRAAQEGRVDTLLITRSRCRAEHGPDDLDAAIGHVLETSGSVAVVDQLPKDVSEGAILRY